MEKQFMCQMLYSNNFPAALFMRKDAERIDEYLKDI